MVSTLATQSLFPLRGPDTTLSQFPQWRKLCNRLLASFFLLSGRTVLPILRSSIPKYREEYYYKSYTTLKRLDDFIQAVVGSFRNCGKQFGQVNSFVGG